MMSEEELDDSIGEFSDLDSLLDPYEEEEELEEEEDSRPSSAGTPTTPETGLPPPLEFVPCGGSFPLITKFERARVLGVRAQQLAQLAPSQIESSAKRDALSIAQQEFEQDLVPLTVRRRHLQEGTEEWPVRELIHSREQLEQRFDLGMMTVDQ